MLALVSASPGLNPTLVLIIIGAVIVAVFWRMVLKIVIAALIIGFVFLLVSSLLDILHGLHALIP
jgi:hypothetical protein